MASLRESQSAAPLVMDSASVLESASESASESVSELGQLRR
jgi:hypothetical protein